MNDADKSREQVLEELAALRGQVAELAEANARLRTELEERKSRFGKSRGEPVESITTGLDAAALQESQERFQRLLERASNTFFEAWSRRLVESASDAFLVVERGGRIVNVNRAACDWLGYAHDELLKLSMPDILMARDVQKFSEMWEHLIPGGAPVTAEETYVRRDGSAFPVEVRGTLVELAGLPHMLALARDVTERKRAEQQAIRLERLRALGDMAEGVSHNLNNILFGVLAPAQLLQRTSADPETLRRVDEIIASTGQAVDLLQRLHYALKGEEDDKLQPVYVAEAVNEAVRVTRPRWKDEPESMGVAIDVTLELADVPHVKGTPGGLQRALVNLILNAVDAMPQGGSITIRAEAAGNGARITVSHTGPGMDEISRRRAFEPYFSHDDAGVGLGLFTVYAAITRWGGTVDVDSSPGEGAAFSLWLPAWTGPVAEERAPADAAASTSPPRAGRVMVVENEEIIRRLMYELLSGSHEVETFASGREALERFGPGDWDAAIIDLGMPGIPGDQIARQIKMKDNSIATILLTGWRLAESDPRLSAFDFRLQKPVNLDDVENAVFQAIRLRDSKTGTEKP